MFNLERLCAVAGLAVVVLFALTLTSSGDSPRELYETAKKYERLADGQRAAGLYQQIVADHPGSHFARYSSYRLRNL